MSGAAQRRWRRVAWALLAVEVVASALDLFWGPFSRVHWEERFNARSGVMFACGHLDDAFTLQYRTFCGGCTAESLMAAPLFQAFGATNRVWKLVPEAFHLAVVGAGAAVAARAGGARGAVAFLLLMIGSPGVYRELAHTGWGNHVEGQAFPLVALALLLATPGRAALTRGALSAVAGLILGLGLWFSHMSAHLAPVVALAGLLLVPRWLPLIALTGAAGLTPWWLYHRARPRALAFTEGWMGTVDVAPLSAWADWLWGPGMRAGLWDHRDYGDVPIFADAWWFGAWGLLVLGVVAGAWAWRSPERPPRRWWPAALVGPIGVAALLVAYALRYDLWSNLPDPYAVPSFNLRYRVPLWPALALCAAPVLACASPRLRRGTWALVGVLAATGVALRVSLWAGPRPAFSGLEIYDHDGWSDDTVPIGEPPQTRKEAQGRAQDIEAALAYLDRHADPLPACRRAHGFELGRRVGVALLADPARGDLPAALSEAAATASGDPVERQLLARGIAKGLAPRGGIEDRRLGPALDALVAVELDLAVAAEAGVLATGRHPPDSDAVLEPVLDPRAWAGLCFGRGREAVSGATRRGERRPGAVGPHGGACGALTSPGLAAGWGRWVGCDPHDARELVDQIGPLDPEVRRAYRLSCLEHRGRAPDAHP